MNLSNSLLRGFVPVTALAFAAMVSSSAQAQVTNGGFGTGLNYQITESQVQYGSNCSSPTCQTLSGWTNTGGFDFVTDGTSNATGISNTYLPSGDKVTLDSGLVQSSNGGDFVALDADTGFNGANTGSGNLLTGTPGGLSQSVTLVGGASYTLTFLYAADEQSNRHATSPINVNLLATLDGTSVSKTDSIENSFDGWQTATETFTATGSGAFTLNFLASDGQNNVPAFALLDGVTLTQNTSPTPEPNSLVLLGTGLAGLGGLVRSRFTKATIKA